MKKFILLSIIAIFTFASCEEMFEPRLENILTTEQAIETPVYAQGILLNAYLRMPTNTWSFNDVATDNAVSNDINNEFRRIAEGGWTAINNPMDQWRNAFAAIQHINTFLSIVDSVQWVDDPVTSRMFANRMRGEALALRGLFMYHLLQRHAGPGSDGQLLGVPIILEPLTPTSDFNLPRATFEECMRQLYADLDSAIAILPRDYGDIANANQIPVRYEQVTENIAKYNRVYGPWFRGRISARIAMAIRAKAALLAASPAFNPTGDQELWATAANYAAQVLTLPGSPGATMQRTGITWYSNRGELTGLAEGNNPAEILWRGSIETSNALEQQHFPPSLFGNGRVNPTRNLVEAFPMTNGYPIDHPLSGFDPSRPYTNRDMRLGHYIIVNNSVAGPANTTILTGADVTTVDGLNREGGRSTRTGYYMRKLIRQDINVNPASLTTQRRYQPHIRWTEIHLIYAEAANEAWGPTGTGPHATFTALDIIRNIRMRAGVGVANAHAYLNSVSTDQAAMRDLIRNERRLELSFEGFRFWDLRRWNMPLNEPAMGTRITGGVNFEEFEVEDRVFAPHMRFGPIPHSEMLKYNALIQNQGW